MPSTPADDAAPSPSRLSARQRRWQLQILFSTYFAYVGYYFCRKAYGVCKPEIEKAFHLPEAHAATLLAQPWTFFLAAYALGQFVNAAMGRKIGPRILLLTGMAVTLLCNIIFGFANSIATFTGFMIVNGLFQASGWPGSVGAVSHWLRKSERGSIMGVWSTSYAVGNIAVKTFVALMIGYGAIGGYAGWRVSFFGCSIVMGFIWLILLLLQRNRPEDVGLPAFADEEDQLEHSTTAAASTKTEESRRSFFAVLFTPTVLMMGITYLCLKFLRYSLDSWLPFFLAKEFGEGGATPGLYSTIFDYAGISGMIVAGFALDRVFKGRWRSICLLMLLGMLGGFILVLEFGSTGPLILACLYGLVGFMLYGPDSLLAGAAAVEVGGKWEAITAAGCINGIASIGPIIQEQVVGRLFDHYQSTMPYKILATATAAASVLLMSILFFRAHLRDRRARRFIE